MFLLRSCSFYVLLTDMNAARTVDPSIAIPAPPLRVARRRGLPRLSRAALADALREASLAGMLALAASWGLAELAVALLGAGGPG